METTPLYCMLTLGFSHIYQKKSPDRQNFYLVLVSYSWKDGVPKQRLTSLNVRRCRIQDWQPWDESLRERRIVLQYRDIRYKTSERVVQPSQLLTLNSHRTFRTPFEVLNERCWVLTKKGRCWRKVSLPAGPVVVGLYSCQFALRSCRSETFSQPFYRSNNNVIEMVYLSYVEYTTAWRNVHKVKQRRIKFGLTLFNEEHVN